MLINFYLVCTLTFLIHFIGIISLSGRIVGARTKKLGSSISLFNTLIIFSSFAQTLQAALFTKSIESTINSGLIPAISNFRTILLFASIGSFVGALFLPTVHRFMYRGVEIMYAKGSVFYVFMHALKLSTFRIFINSVTLPKFENIYRLNRIRDLNVYIIILNMIVYAFVTVSMIACIYAGCLNKEYRTTALALSGVAVGLGSLCMLVFIEPYNSTLTDKVIDGAVAESYLRRHLIFIIVARVIGTVLSQFLLIPIAKIVAKICEAL